MYNRLAMHTQTHKKIVFQFFKLKEKEGKENKEKGTEGKEKILGN